MELIAADARTITDRYDDIECWLIDKLAELSGSSAEDVDVDRPFRDYQLDSSVAVTLAQELGRMIGASLSATLFWEYPSIRALATALSEPGHA